MGVRPPTKFGPDSGCKIFGVVHLKLAYYIVTCILETMMKHKSFIPLTKIVSNNNGKRLFFSLHSKGAKASKQNGSHPVELAKLSRHSWIVDQQCRPWQWDLAQRMQKDVSPWGGLQQKCMKLPRSTENTLIHLVASKSKWIQQNGKKHLVSYHEGYLSDAPFPRPPACSFPLNTLRLENCNNFLCKFRFESSFKQRLKIRFANP